MPDFPRSLIEFQRRFAHEAARVTYLFAARWPHGFVCPSCGGDKAWQLQTKGWTWECASCGKHTSVTADTIMHHSKLPLTAASGILRGRPEMISVGCGILVGYSSAAATRLDRNRAAKI